MKSRQSFLFVSAALYLLLAVGNIAYSHSGMTSDWFIGRHEDAFFLQQQSDTVPKKTGTAAEALKEAGEKVKEAAKEAGGEAGKKIAGDALKKVAPKAELPKGAPKVDGNLFKKVANFFKFRKNSRLKEKDRILGVFESLGINDSIAATSENIKLLIDELSVRENQHFDTLLAIISAIKIAAEKEDPAPAFTEAKKEDPLHPEPSESKVVTDKDIEDLTNKLLPLITEKVNEDKSGKEKREALSALRKLRLGAGVVNYSKDSAKGIVKRFTLSVKNKAEVIGMHNYTMNNDYTGYKFGYLNTLLYQSLFLNGKTGNIKELNGWDSAQVVSDAQAEGCKVMFTVSMNQPASISSFLSSTVAQKKFTDNALYLLKLRKANGVNIQFDNLPAYESEKFSAFIKFFSDVLKIEDTGYKVMITLPAYDKEQSYDLLTLSESVFKFIVDFSNLPPVGNGALAPLKGRNDYTIETAVSRYLNTDIPADKLIITIPYTGTRWQLAKGDTKGRFIQLLTYSEIRQRYNWPVYYDDESANAIMDSVNERGVTIRRIIFDDDNSLEKKYDFILQNGLGGVSIDALGYDKGYSELWDMLAYKFAIIDTSFLSDSLIAAPLNIQLSWLDKVKRKLSLYWYIVNNPCKVCFDDIQDPKYAATLNLYLQELKIDSLINAENKKLPPAERYKSRFEYINYELTNLLILSSIILFVLLLLATGFYIYQIKVNSTAWKWKKKMELVLLGITIIFVISFFSYLFCDDTIPLFGSAPAVGTNRYETTNTQALGTGANSAYAVVCDTDTNDTCINMPLYTLMGIILAGMLAGFAITRYLILPLIKRDDIP